MKAPRVSHLTTLACSLLLSNFTGAQTKPPAEEGPKNLLRNGDFEAAARPVDNLYDGINAAGNFKVGVISLKVLATGGGLAERKIAPSVVLQDLNHDGKTDVVASLPEGYVYAYFNIGEPKSPAFDHAEILPVFLSRWADQPGAGPDDPKYDRRAPRISFCEWSKPGTYDMLVGNMFGQLLMFNGISNSKEQVSYTTPRDFSTVEIPTQEVKGRYWGNLFSPLAIDWDGDGKKDIIMGEGSYSANSIFLFHNESTSVPPRFKHENRSFLVTGDGREQLVPALADWNGDGRPDVLVADKDGQISLHLRPEHWKLGDELPLTSFVSLAGKDRIGAAITIGTGDYNMDGLFDIVVGEPSGEILIAVNTGNSKEPRFDTLVPLTGVDLWKDNYSLAPSWNLSIPSGEGDALAYSRVVTTEIDAASVPPQGNQCLLVGNYTPPNKIALPAPTPNMANGEIEFRLDQGVTLEQNAKYVLEAQVKGTKVSQIGFEAYARLTARPKNLRVEIDERGGVIGGNHEIEENWAQGTHAAVGQAWTKVSYSFTAKLKHKELQDLPKWGASFTIKAYLPSTESCFYIDDVKLYQVQ